MRLRLARLARAVGFARGCGSARSFAFTEGFDFRRDAMVLVLLVTNGPGFRLITNDGFSFVHLRFLPAIPSAATEAEGPARGLHQPASRRGGARTPGAQGRGNTKILAGQR